MLWIPRIISGLTVVSFAILFVYFLIVGKKKKQTNKLNKQTNKHEHKQTKVEFVVNLQQYNLVGLPLFGHLWL